MQRQTIELMSTQVAVTLTWIEHTAFMPRSDIPFGSEFSPAVIDLRALLELVAQHQPERRKLQAAIDNRFFAGKGKNADPRKTLADNTILSMFAYHILERVTTNDLKLSDFGRALYDARNSQDELRDLMGKHCLVRLPGMIVLDCIDDMIAAGDQLTKLTIANALRERGLHYPENGKHLNVLRQWLEFAGIVNPNGEKSGDGMWTPDANRMRQLTGVDSDDVTKWTSLTRAQYDFARAFALMGVNQAAASDVRDYARDLYGTEFPEGGLPQSVLNALEELGLITTTKTTTGRGAKSHLVQPTDRIKNELLLPILEQSRSKLGPVHRRLLRTNLDEILAKVNSPKKHEKGIALEALAFYFCRRLDLEFVDWRLRGVRTDGAEVDIIVEGARLIFSRWQIQCKNAKAVSVEDVAKEVGIATAMRTNVILLVTTGAVPPSAVRFADRIRETSPKKIAILGREELRRLLKKPSSLRSEICAQAPGALAVQSCSN